MSICVGCLSSQERASRVSLSGGNDFITYKVLDIERRFGYTIFNRGYYPKDPNINAVYVEFEIKNISNFNVEISLQPVVPLPGGEAHKMSRVAFGGSFWEKAYYSKERFKYEIEAVKVENEILSAGGSLYRVFVFLYPVRALPDSLLFQAKKEGEDKFETIQVALPKS